MLRITKKFSHFNVTFITVFRCGSPEVTALTAPGDIFMKHELHTLRYIIITKSMRYHVFY